jgi:hypothetical protein
MKTSSIIGLLLFLAITGLRGQEHHENGSGGEQTEAHPKNMVGLGFGFTFIPVAAEVHETEARGLFVPTIGLDYFRHLGKHWEVGIMADYELMHYMIVDEQLEREQALLLTLLGMYKIGKRWGIYAGGGIEFEPHHNLAVFRLGTEYTIDLKKNWALIPKVFFDFKESYNTWSLQFSFAKLF